MTRCFRPKLALALMLAAMAFVPATAQASWLLGPSGPPTTQQGGHSGTAMCSEVCSGGGYTAAAQTGEPGVPPTLGALRGSNLAAVNRAEAQQAHARRMPPSGGYSNADINTYASTVHPTAAVTPANTTSSDAFDWTDAAIGAGVATTIALLLMVTGVAVRRRGQTSHV
jgi:hypothetical protein